MPDLDQKPVTLFGDPVAVGREFYEILDRGCETSSPPFLIQQAPESETPAIASAVSTGDHDFARHGTCHVVRSSSGLVCSLSTDGRRLVYYYSNAATPLVTSVVLDEFCPLVRDLKGDLCLHAGLVVSPKGKGIVLLGDSGTGKSTAALIAALRPGWRAASDDSLVVRREGIKLLAVPSYPGIRVRPDTLSLSESTRAVVRDCDLPAFKAGKKLRILPRNVIDPESFFHRDPVDLAAVVDLQPTDHPPRTKLVPANRSTLLKQLLLSTFSVPSLGNAANVRRFDQVADVVNSVDSFVAKYAKSVSAVDDLFGNFE